MNISTSVLTVEENGNEIETFYRIEAAKTDYFHIDVMDGEFVENNTADKMKRFADTLSNITLTPIEVHLMCKNVKSFVDEYSPINPNTLIFHIEVCENENQVMEYINFIKEKGIKVGIALNPETSPAEVEPYLKYIHEVLVMTVHPGYGGQAFINETVDKISDLRRFIDENDLDTEINCDGGINSDTIVKVKDAGAETAVVGSAMINAIDYKYMMNKLKNT